MYTASAISDPAFDEASGSPVVNPLRSLKEALSWRPCFDEFSVAWQPLRPRTHAVADDGHKKARLLVCHDMLGGYLNDKFVQGAKLEGEEVPFYIRHWHMIDMFIYFSHELITLPPPMWTNCAHAHGVPVLGTLITEHDSGRDLCQRFLVSVEAAHHLADQLVAMAKYYRFDGWLINIENELSMEALPPLVEFLRRLTLRIHQEIGEHGRVLWYDSVTHEGKLKWQDELSAENHMFYEACDGIFLNYTWTEEKLKASAMMAGADGEKVYVGIDVFGRGCPGGGGYNCKEALEKIISNSLSAALFAPGWVHQIEDKSRFGENSEKFWSLLEPYCVTHSVTSLPLATSFGLGAGQRFFVDGKLALNKPWSHLSMQDFQPGFPLNSHVIIGNNEALSIENGPSLKDERPFNGGQCLSFEGTLQRNFFGSRTRSAMRLFSTEVDVRSSPLLVSYHYQTSLPDVVELAVVLLVELSDGQCAFVVLPSLERSTESSCGPDTLDERLIDKYGLCRSSTLDSSRWSHSDSDTPEAMPYLAFSSLDGEDHMKLQKLSLGISNVEEIETIATSPTSWKSRHFLLAGTKFRSYHVKEVQLFCSAPEKEPVNWPEDREELKFSVNFGELLIAEARWVKSESHGPAYALRCGGVQWQRQCFSSTPVEGTAREFSTSLSSGDLVPVWLDLTLLWDHAKPEEVAWFNIYVYGLDAHRFTQSPNHDIIRDRAPDESQLSEASLLAAPVQKRRVSISRQPDGEAEFIGRAYGLSFHLPHLSLLTLPKTSSPSKASSATQSPTVPAPPQCLWFAVQAVSLARFKQPLERTPKVCFTWST